MTLILGRFSIATMMSSKAQIVYDEWAMKKRARLFEIWEASCVLSQNVEVDHI